MGSNLFRQQALDSVETPDKINDYIQVSGPSFYLWLLSILICVIAICIWAFNTTVNDFVKIKGIAFPHQQLVHVPAPLDGRVSQVFVQKGDQIKKGDLMLRYRSENGIHELRSNVEGTVLSHKIQQENFVAMEPCVYILPNTQVDKMKEIIAFVTYSHLRKLEVGMQVQATPADLKREEVGYMYGRITSINELPTSLNEAKEIFRLEEFITSIFPSEASFMVKIILEDDPQDKEGIRWSHKGDDEIDIKIGTFCDMQVVTRKRKIFDLLFNR
jgi:hypothetical protein